MELFTAAVLARVEHKLKEHKETIAVAESVSSGLLQLAFSQMKDAACFYQGGLTAYNLAQKAIHLRVEPIHANEVNCVSPDVSEKMALEICTAFLSDWGIGITGYATPVKESGGKLFACYAIAYKDRILQKNTIYSKTQDPLQVQLEYTNAVLEELSFLLERNR